MTIPNSVTTIGRFAFGFCRGLTSMTIGNSVTSIGNGAFVACNSLISATIGNSVTSIGDNAFDGSGLTSVIIPNSVASIGNSAFYKCYNLTSVTIGNSVTTIGNSAFELCKDLAEITCFATTPPVLGTDAFRRISLTIPVYVPCASVAAYQTATGWKSFSNISCQSEGISDVDGSSANVIAANGQIVIENADGNTVTLYDATGCIQAIKQSNNQAVIFDVPASGTYLVKIGSFQARKVVVIR